MRFKPQRIEEALSPIILAAAKNVIVLDFDTDGIQSRELKNIVVHVHEEVLLTVKSLNELRNVYFDTLITYKMAQRYPWRPSRIRKAEHLKLIWFQFVNLCYLFEEKTKLFYGRYLRCCATFSQHNHKLPLKSCIKKIRKKLDHHIRSRGQTFHEWYANHKAVQDLDLIEVVSSLDPTRDWDVEGHYKEAKFILSANIQAALLFMEEFLIEVIQAESPAILELISKFDLLLAHCRNHEE